MPFPFSKKSPQDAFNDLLWAQMQRQSDAQLEELLTLARLLSQVLVPVKPSDAFVEDLRQQLLTATPGERRTWYERVRQLPPGVQLAAGIGGATLTAGVVLAARRPVMDALDLWRSRRSISA
ncbi:MAG: hypothetical protein GXY36_05535 [Chloroflexi bacterium]|nr:hypothetical protein [Chloroflexota bacterium]